MYVPDIELHEPKTLEEAVAATAGFAPNARLLAGGTDLLVDLKTGRVAYTHLVSINRIDSLRGVSEESGGLRIGALTTITGLSRTPLVQRRFAPILDATSKMAAAQIRNVATVGGNIASAVPCADLPPILTAMKASVALWSPKGERQVAMDRFFIGARQTVLRNEEVMITVNIPEPPRRFGAAYARFGLRDGNTIAVASVAAGLQLDTKGKVHDARIVLGAVAPVPKLVESAAAALVGNPPADDAFRMAAEISRDSAEPISDIRGSADYRRELVAVLTRRALIVACRRAKETL